VLRRVHAVIERYDRTWSRFRTDSTVAAIAERAGNWRLPAEAAPLFDLYRRLYLATDGAMSPLVGRALERMGYDREFTLRPSGPAAPVPAWEDMLAWDGETLTTVSPALLDVGAAGKGQLVDLVGEVLDAAGAGDWVVDASGDLRVSGPPIRVGLEHPLDPTKAIGVVNVGDRALCASAVNRRSWGDGLHHVIDATTGLPTRRVIATWAVADSAMVADGLATALFFAEPARLQREFDFGWVIVRSDLTVAFSPELDGEVFS
jgi:thiamine biosynthesis lipoprotein